MRQRRYRKGEPLAGLALIGAALLLAGCGQQVTPTTVQASGSTLCLSDFERCVSPILDASLRSSTGTVTCSASGCHSQASGSGGAFKIFPNAQPGSTEIMANFFAAKGFANLNDPQNSKLLLEPDAGFSSIAGSHAGGDIFPNGSDACHVAIANWISIRVDNENSASCGTCTPAVTSSCGY